MSSSYPEVIYKNGSDKSFMSSLLDGIPSLTEKYHPPSIWGTSGHIQTAVQSILEKRPGLDLKKLRSTRHTTQLNDSSRITFDIFQKDISSEDKDITLMVCPGIANSSENAYMKSFALHSVKSGYNVAILNLLGVLESEELTTPRIFNFGSTEEYHAMVMCVRELYPATMMIAVGFSLGANLVCKYLGEDISHQKHFLACISLCQGYNISELSDHVNSWTKMRKLYGKAICNKYKSVVLKNYDTIGRHISCGRETATATLRKIKTCNSVPKIDRLITLRLTGHNKLEDYYTWASCCHYMNNIDIPVMYLNAKDDPLFPKSLLKYPKRRALEHERCMFVLTHHGGHLGFFTKTGSRHFIDSMTWLEKVTLQYISSVVEALRREKTLPSAPYNSYTGLGQTNENQILASSESNKSGDFTDIRVNTIHPTCRKSQHSWKCSYMIDSNGHKRYLLEKAARRRLQTDL